MAMKFRKDVMAEWREELQLWIVWPVGHPAMKWHMTKAQMSVWPTTYDESVSALFDAAREVANSNITHVGSAGGRINALLRAARS